MSVLFSATASLPRGRNSAVNLGIMSDIGVLVKEHCLS